MQSKYAYFRGLGLLAVFSCIAACANSGDNDDTRNPEAAEMTREERLELRRQLQQEKKLEEAPGGDVPATTGEVPDSLLDAIMRDLEGRTGADRSAFTVIRAESVQWNDGALGCPEPGQTYTQAIVDGYRVVIEHDGRKNDYRATESGYFRLCAGFKPNL